MTHWLSCTFKYGYQCLFQDTGHWFYMIFKRLLVSLCSIIKKQEKHSMLPMVLREAKIRQSNNNSLSKVSTEISNTPSFANGSLLSWCYF